jgi:anti-sigma factor RsiW
VKLSHDDIEYLMAYVDGQLDEDEVRDVEALLAKNEEARRLVSELGAVGDWVRESCDAKATVAKADRIVDAVMAEADKLGGGKVITLERERARRALNRQRVKEFGALAAVAAVFVLLWAWPGSRGAVNPEPEMVAKGPPFASPMPRPPEKAPVSPGGLGVSPSSPADSPKPPEGVLEGTAEGSALAVGSEEGVDIENVESPHQVSVFYLPVTNKNAASVVVWIGEPEEVH